MKTAIITIGASGSGKSTWARKHKQERQKSGEDWMIIERDEERKMLKTKSSNHVNFWSEWDWKLEGKVTEACNHWMNVALTAKSNIIVSDTNLNKMYRDQLIERLKKHGYTIELKHFNMPYKKLVERDNQRADSVGQQVIAKQYFQYMEEFGSEFGFHKLQNASGKESCILVDVDGTLAHMDGRRGPFEWEKVGMDRIDTVVRDIVNNLGKTNKVIIMSGRDSVCRDETYDWLIDNGVNFDALYMRPEGDTRPDFDVKNEIIQNHINGMMNVTAWFDDRPQITRLANILGAKIFALGNQTIEF